MVSCHKFKLLQLYNMYRLKRSSESFFRTNLFILFTNHSRLCGFFFDKWTTWFYTFLYQVLSTSFWISVKIFCSQIHDDFYYETGTVYLTVHINTVNRKYMYLNTKVVFNDFKRFTFFEKTFYNRFWTRSLRQNICCSYHWCVNVLMCWCVDVLMCWWT